MAVLEMLLDVGSFLSQTSAWKVATGTFVTVLIALIVKSTLTKWLSPLRRIPGPPGLPILGNAFDLKEEFFADDLVRWANEYGGIFTFHPGPVTRVLVTEPRLCKQFLVTDAMKYNRPTIFKEFIPSLGHSLLTANGAEHAQMRKLINPAFSYSNLKGMVSYFKSTADNLVQKWQKQLENSSENFVDIMAHDDLTLATLDIIGESAFGYKFKCVRNGHSKMSKAFHDQVVGVSLGKLEQFVPFYKYLPLEENRIKKQAIKITDETIRKVIRERQTRRAEEREEEGRRDLLDLLLDLYDEETGRRMEGDELKEQIFAFLAGGHETSSVALAWILYELADEPDIQKRIREEVDAVLGDFADVTWSKLDQLNLLTNVVKEGMRLHPPFIGTSRVAVEDTMLGDYQIPAGTVVIAGFYAIHRMAKHWKEPLKFNPDRFGQMSDQEKSAANFLNMPFSNGPRMCIGYKFAMAEMRLVLASVLRHFEFSRVPGLKITTEVHLAAKPSPSLQLRIKTV